MIQLETVCSQLVQVGCWIGFSAIATQYLSPDVVGKYEDDVRRATLLCFRWEKECTDEEGKERDQEESEQSWFHEAF